MSASKTGAKSSPRNKSLQRNSAVDNPALVQRLLAWYDRNHRILPWRAKPGELQDPYRVWLSEIMLQQTTVPAVIPYFLKFTQRWPDIKALAAASQEEVMSAWAGLGYYSRARNLHACAQVVTHEHGGRMPSDEEGLRALPGIGPYTSAAIAAIAFGRKAAPVDGNIERVLTRLRCVREPLPTSKPKLKELADDLAPAKRSGDFAQAMMDLGSGICTPKSPTCEVCPWENACEARRLGLAESLPARLAKRVRPQKRAAAFVLFSSKGEVFLRRRPEKGLLASMHETPTSAFGPDFPEDADSVAPVVAGYRKLDTIVRHTFTHFDLELEIHVANVDGAKAKALKGEWAKLTALEDFALPNLFRKVIEAAQEKGPPRRARRA
jgi:A/G-specific adenine glycosylase